MTEQSPITPAADGVLDDTAEIRVALVTNPPGENAPRARGDELTAARLAGYREGSDELLWRQAQADREKELELTRIARDRATGLERIRAEEATDRRRRRGYVLAGLAVVVILLVGIAALWTNARLDARDNLRREQLRQQTAQACIRAGNIWINGSCLIARRDAPAPQAG